MIQHSVIFTLRYPEGSSESIAFFKAASELAILPGVENFKIFRQINLQNSFGFGIVMTFQNKQLYQQYTDHPKHTFFVDQYWLKTVLDFLEIDYEPLSV